MYQRMYIKNGLCVIIKKRVDLRGDAHEPTHYHMAALGPRVKTSIRQKNYPESGIDLSFFCWGTRWRLSKSGCFHRRCDPGWVIKLEANRW